MPVMDELLNQVEEYANTGEVYEAGIYCDINPDTRTIYIPDEYSVIGVEGDSRVERLWFRCPKIVGDNIDLSQHTLVIGYRNNVGHYDRYECEDVTVDGDDITFSWLMGPYAFEEDGTVTNADGVVTFAIRAQMESENPGVMVTVWNTTLATLTIRGGMDYSNSIAKQNPDIINKIETELEQIKETGSVLQAGENIIIENGVISVVTTSNMQQDNTKPITSAGVYAVVGNIAALLEAL